MSKAINLSAKSILSTALPVMLGGLIQFIITFTDTAFLGQLGELALNTAGNASLIYMTLLISFQGFCEAYQILIAKFLGQKNEEEIKSLNQRGILFFLVLGLIGFFVFYFLSGWIIAPAFSSELLQQSMTSYLSIRAFGFLPAILQLALIYYFMGMADTRILSYAMIITAGFNIALDYALIFGHFGLPEMGTNGAALATVIAEISSLLFTVFYLFYHKKHRILWWPLQAKYSLRFATKVFKKGLPLLFQRFFSMGGWTFFFILLEILGSTALAASQIIRTLYFLAFIPIMGFGSTARTYVSYFLSQGDVTLVKKSMIKIALFSLVFTFLLIHGFWFYPELIIGFITPDPTLIDLSVEIIRLIAFSMLIFSVASIYFSAIAGVGDSAQSLYIESFCLILYLSLAYFLSRFWGGNVLQMWALEFVYFGSLGLLSYAYFKCYKWKRLKPSI